jgi:hypothetical protein
MEEIKTIIVQLDNSYNPQKFKIYSIIYDNDEQVLHTIHKNQSYLSGLKINEKTVNVVITDKKINSTDYETFKKPLYKVENKLDQKRKKQIIDFIQKKIIRIY